jgi:hypothetical protein
VRLESEKKSFFIVNLNNEFYFLELTLKAVKRIEIKVYIYQYYNNRKIDNYAVVILKIRNCH